MNIKFNKNIKLLKLIPLIIIAVMLLVQIFTLSSILKILNSTKDEEAVQEVIAVNKPLISKDALYCLYECGGKIGIYDAKSRILIDIINVYTSTLPKSDQQLLRSGIEIFTFSELSSIIDDFSS